MYTFFTRTSILSWSQHRRTYTWYTKPNFRTVVQDPNMLFPPNGNDRYPSLAKNKTPSGFGGVSHGLFLPWDIHWEMGSNRMSWDALYKTNPIRSHGTHVFPWEMSMEWYEIFYVTTILFPHGNSSYFPCESKTHLYISLDLQWNFARILVVHPTRYPTGFPIVRPMGLPMGAPKSHTKPHEKSRAKPHEKLHEKSNRISLESSRIPWDIPWNSPWDHILPMGNSMGPVTFHGKSPGDPKGRAPGI